mgnify:CR=1 FL=1
MQKTTNYQLPKWEKTDRILMDDFNGMTAALDTALHGVAVSAEAAQAAVDSEAADRQAADAALGTRITGETAARADAVTAERASCSAALSAETTARINADAAEATERANADAALQSAINGKAASSHTHAQSAITGLTAALAERPCIEFSTYVGGDSKTQKVFTFSKPPKAVFILGHWTTSEKHTQCILGLFLQGAPCGTMFSLTHNSSASTNVPQSAWSGNTLTLTPPSSSGANAEAILDSPYYTYRVAAFC